MLAGRALSEAAMGRREGEGGSYARDAVRFRPLARLEHQLN